MVGILLTLFQKEMESNNKSSQDTNFSSQSDMFASQSGEEEGEHFRGKDPYALDPCFENEEEMKAYLKSLGQIDVIITPDDLEVTEPAGETLRVCDCGECGPESDDDGVHYLCCNQRFITWVQDLCDKEEETPVCITHSKVKHIKEMYYILFPLFTRRSWQP